MNSDILKFRKKIDHLDDQIIRLLHKRFQIVEKIGIIKKTEDIAFTQPNRIHEIIETRKKMACEMGIPEDLIEKIYHLIIEESINQEKKS